MTLLRPINLGELLGDISAKQKVTAFQRMLLGVMEGVGRLRVIAPFAGDYTDMPINLSAPRRLLVSRNGQQLIALRQRLVEATTRDVELDLVDGEVELTGTVAFFLESERRLVVSLFGVSELAQLHVSKGDVIEDLRFVIAHPESLITEMAQTKGFECAAQITANYCHSAEVLIDHSDQCGIRGDLGFGAGSGVDRSSLIEVATDLIDNADDVQRLGDRRGGSADICRRDGCLEHIERSAAIAQLEIGSAQPA